MPNLVGFLDDHRKVDAYNTMAALNPDATHMIPSCYGRAKLPLVPVRLTSQTTITVAASQNCAIAFPPCFVSGGSNFTPTAAGYVNGAIGSDQSAAAVTQIDFPVALSSVVPTAFADSATYPAYMVGTGSVHVETIKGSMLDEDPSFLWTGAASSKGYQQISLTGAIDPTTANADQNMPAIQSVLGSYTLNSLGNELPKARERGRCFYGSLPPLLNRKGIFTPLWFRSAASIGADGTKWGTGSCFTQPTSTPGLEVPILSITNSSSTNALKVVLTISRNFFVVPSEQFLASSTAILQPESESRIQNELLVIGSIGAAGPTIDEAHSKALLQAKSVHPMVKTTWVAPSVDMSVLMTQSVAKGPSAQPAPLNSDMLNVVKDWVRGMFHNVMDDFTQITVTRDDVSRLAGLARDYALNYAQQRLIGQGQGPNLGRPTIMDRP